MKSKEYPIFTFALIFLVIAGCVTVSSFITRRVAENELKSALDSFTGRAIQRVEMTIHDSLDALNEAGQIAIHDCEPDQLESLRRLALEHRYVQDIIFVMGNIPQCSALREHFPVQVLPPADWKNSSGLSAWYGSRDMIGIDRPMFFLRKENFIAVIDAKSLVDITPMHAENELAILETGNNRIISSWSGVDGAALEEASKRNLDKLIEESRYYSIRKSDIYPIAVAASLPIERLGQFWLRLLAVWIPIALLVSALMTWALLRLLHFRQSLQFQLEEALLRDQFFVCYQPIVDLATKRCVGAEALVRWRLADGSIVPPDLFIPIAEANDLIKAITDRLIDHVFSDLGETLAADRKLHISINIAAEDLKTDRVLIYLRKYLKSFNVNPQQICIEATERGFMDADFVCPVINSFRAAGHSVYIDDFGTGYSSLAYLQSLKVDVLKIDKAFVDTIGAEAASSLVTPHIIEMAHELKLEIVAEGVETQVQADYLCARGVQYGQGWLFGKPMIAGDFIEYLSCQAQAQAQAQCSLKI